MARTMQTARKSGAPPDSIRYRGVTYRVGQAVLVNPADDDNSLVYIAQIRRFDPIPDPRMQLATVAARRAANPSPRPNPKPGPARDREEFDETANVHVRWYYRPEEAAGGRRPFQAVRELLMSDHDDTVPLGSLIGPARVLSLAEFARVVPLERRRLDPTPAARGKSRGGGAGSGGGGGGGAGGAPFVEEELPTYFARLMYRPGSGTYVPDRLPVFCTCESAYAPDGPAMICCPSCHEFFHPQCVGISPGAADRIRRELGLPSDPADVGAPPPRPLPADARAPWLCQACRDSEGRAHAAGRA